MEVAEKIAFKTDQFIPFGLQRAAESELYCVASRSKAYTLELVYNHHCDERIFMEQSTLGDITKFMPSHGVPKNAVNIFNKSTKQEQDRLLVDYHLMTEELKISSDRVAISQIRWSPIRPNSPGKYYLAYLTNFGGCEIRQKHTGKLSWCFVVHNVAREWMLMCQKNMKYAFNTFQSFEDAVNSVKITAIAWNNLAIDNQHLSFCCFTNDGTVAVYEIGETTLQLQFQKKLNLNQVNAIEWFTFNDKNNKPKSYMVACSTAGAISLLGVLYDNGCMVDVVEITKLFSELDGVCANGIQWEYCKQTNQLIFLICKGMHVCAYLFSPNTETVLSSCIHYVGHLTINGITKRSPLEYVVGTLGGHLECLRLKIDANTIDVDSEDIKQPNGHSKYVIYGLATSLNNAFLLAAYFAGRPFDHLVLREPGHVAVLHQLNGTKSIDMLLKNPTYNLSHTQDLAEAIRNMQLRNDQVFKDYFDVYPTEIVCTDQYKYSLKVRLILTSARSTYLRQKNRMIESGNLLGEYNILKKFIFAIHSYSTLMHLNENSKKLNQFQIISGQCHRTTLYEFINLSIFDEYEAIKMPFHHVIENLLSATDDFDKRAVEKCVYCDGAVDRVKGVCEKEHDLPRCCISMTQIPLMNQRQCIHCQSVALDDMTKLKQVVPSITSDEPICPLCDVPMVRPHLTFFDYSD